MLCVISWFSDFVAKRLKNTFWSAPGFSAFAPLAQVCEQCLALKKAKINALMGKARLQTAPAGESACFVRKSRIKAIRKSCI